MNADFSGLLLFCFICILSNLTESLLELLAGTVVSIEPCLKYLSFALDIV